MRLIDADALRREHCNGCSADIREDCKIDPICASLMWVHEAPTVDAVPVVRCKDCARQKKGFCTIRKDSFGATLLVGEHDFCSDGERKNDGR